MKTNKEMIEEAVANIVSNTGDCVYGMNIDCSIKEAKRLYSELENSQLLKEQITETITTLLTKHEEAILQKDIERLEGMEWKINERDKGESLQEKLGHNEVLQTLIEIKRKELEELNKNETN